MIHCDAFMPYYVAKALNGTAGFFWPLGFVVYTKDDSSVICYEFFVVLIARIIICMHPFLTQCILLKSIILNANWAEKRGGWGVGIQVRTALVSVFPEPVMFRNKTENWELRPVADCSKKQKSGHLTHGGSGSPPFFPQKMYNIMVFIQWSIVREVIIL